MREAKEMPLETLISIRANIRKLEQRAKKIEHDAEKRVALAAALIARHKLSLSDWKRAVLLSKKKRHSSSRKTKAAKRVPIKYADDKGNKWSGRGRTPLWLLAAEKAGRKRATFLVRTKEQLH
jgi:DNA-binding protein H-NS